MKIVYFGTPQFAANVLRFLIQKKVKVIAIVTQPDKPKGRSKKLAPSPVKLTAQELLPDIPIYQPEKASYPPFIETLRKLKADLFVVVAFGQILNQNLLDVPLKDSINVHASLLPKYRGAAPIHKAIMDGESETGVTIMKMVRKLDAGDVLHVVKTPISSEETFGELEKKLCELSGPALLEILDQYERNAVAPVAQNDAQATFAPKITAENSRIDWSLSAQKIHDHIRGLSPRPGAWCWVDLNGEQKRMKILRASVIKLSGKPGSNLSFHPDSWVIATSSGSLQVLEVQLEGKKVMLASDFIKGLRCEVKPLLILK